MPSLKRRGTSLKSKGLTRTYRKTSHACFFLGLYYYCSCIFIKYNCFILSLSYLYLGAGHAYWSAARRA